MVILLLGQFLYKWRFLTTPFFNNSCLRKGNPPSSLHSPEVDDVLSWRHAVHRPVRWIFLRPFPSQKQRKTSLRARINLILHLFSPLLYFRQSENGMYFSHRKRRQFLQTGLPSCQNQSVTGSYTRDAPRRRCSSHDSLRKGAPATH